MKSQIGLILFVVVILPEIFSCERSGKNSIVYQSVNKEFVLIRDVEALKVSNDDISNHVDSILSGLINAEFISTGRKDFNLNFDVLDDVGFEIIDLNLFNPEKLPESFDSLAARVDPLTIEILDNSTWGYPDALDEQTEISEEGYWSSKTSVLGTFMDGGQFQGMDEKYLGIRFPDEGDYKYGWIKLYCSAHNDTLRIIEYAYNDIPDSKIFTGQKE